MKLHRSPTNNSDGIFSVSFSFILRSSSVHPPFILRSSSVQPPFELRSSSVQPPFELRSTSVRAPFELRSSSVQPPLILRSFSVRRSKIDRRTNGESSEAKRRCIETLMGNQGKGNPNKNFIFNHFNSNYYDKTYSWLHHFSVSLHSVYWKSMSYVKIMGGFGWRIDEVRSNSPVDIEFWYKNNTNEVGMALLVLFIFRRIRDLFIADYFFSLSFSKFSLSCFMKRLYSVGVISTLPEMRFWGWRFL